MASKHYFAYIKPFLPLRKQFEHSHAQHLLEVMAHPHQEMALMINHLRDHELQALQSLEKVHHQREKCLEEEALEESFLSVCHSVCSLDISAVSLIFIVVQCEKAAGAGDEKTTSLFQPQVTAWCVGREPALTYTTTLFTHHSNTLPNMHMCTVDYINLQQN